VTDLHTHILSGIDDGAKTIEESISMLCAQVNSGVTTAALTPHFELDAAEQQDFLLRYNRLFNELCEAANDYKLPIRLLQGAEVAFTAITPELDLDSLCYEGTKTILIELPMSHYPPFSREVLYRMQLEGYTPMIAHAERYRYFARKPDLLEKLVRSGTLIQVNAESVIKRGRKRRRVLKMISNNLVHVIATDIHSMTTRLPTLDKAAKIVEKKLGPETAQRLVNFKL